MTTKTVDHHGPGQQLAPGDWIVTPRCVYRVDAVRPVESRQWPERWRYTCTKITDRDVDSRRVGVAAPDGVRVCTTSTYGPGERPGGPAFQPCDHPDCRGCG